MYKNQLQKIEKTLSFIAKQEGIVHEYDFLNSLSLYLRDLFNSDFVIIDKYSINRPKITESVSLCDYTGILPNINYKLAGTPCENVINGEFCNYNFDVQKLFPEDSLLIEMNVESYIGIPLWSSLKEPIGLISLLYKNPLKETKTIELVLKI